MNQEMQQQIQQFISDAIQQQVPTLIDAQLDPIGKKIKAVELGGGLVPFHKHNGIDSPQIILKDLSRIFVRTATYDPPNLADGTGTTTTVATPGAGLGDFALASFSLDLQGITTTAYVSSNDVVSVRLQNETGGAINLGSGTLRIMVFRKQS